MTIRNFADHLTKYQLQKGEEYFNRNKVRTLKVDDFGRWKAKVQGRELYEVEISLRNQQIRSVSCECIAHTDHKYCKHVVAVLYAIQHKEGILKTDEELKDMVKNMSAAELRKFILEQADKNPGLQEKLSSWAEQEDDEEDKEEIFELSATGKKLFDKMQHALAKFGYEKAKAIAEKGIQDVKEKGNEEDYAHIRKAIVEALKNSNEIMGKREFARRFYKESRDMYFYGILKETYIRDEWQKVVTAHIARLEAKIPEYAAGTANPSELGDVYLAEYEDHHALLKLMQQVPRLSFVNEFAEYVNSDYAGGVLLVYREALLQFARTFKKKDDTAEFLTGIKMMATLKGGKQAAKELTTELQSLNDALFALVPDDIKKSVSKTDHSFYTTLALQQNEMLIDKGKAALDAGQYQQAIDIGLAIVKVVPAPFNGWDEDDKEMAAIKYINKGFALLLIIGKAGIPQPFHDALYNHALQKVYEKKYVLDDYEPHWIEILVAMRTGKEQQVLTIVEELLKREEIRGSSRVRLLKLRTGLLKALGRGGEIYQMMAENPHLYGLRKFFIREAEEEGNHQMVVKLAEEGLQINSEDDNDEFRYYLDLCFRLAQKYNNTKRIRQLALAYYLGLRDMQYYRLIKSTYAKNEWDEVEPIINDLAAKYSPDTKLLQVLSKL